MTPQETITDLVSKLVKADIDVESFRNGNTALLRELMAVLNGDGDLLPQFKESITEVLDQAGMVDSDGALRWAALEARKPKPVTWAYAVGRYVVDPIERERLLALDIEIS